MTVLYQYDMNGGDIGGNRGPLNYTDCCNLCLNTTGCLGFVSGWPNNTDTGARLSCWLKNTINTPNINLQYTSAHF